MTERQKQLDHVDPLDFPGAGALRNAGSVEPPAPWAVARALTMVQSAAARETASHGRTTAPLRWWHLTRRRGVLAAAVTVAAVAAGITFHGTGTETARPAGEPSGPVRAESAAVFLERIAQVAHTRPATADARYWKVRAESAYTGVKPRPAVDTYFDRSMDIAVVVTDGRTHRKPGDFSWRLGPRKLESREALNRLPTDPAKLVALMNSSREYGGQSAFLQAGTLLGSTPARPEVRAALYRAVARLDGVTLTGPVRDSAGRTGTELVFRGAVATDHLVVDPRTGVLLETRSVTTKGVERGKVRRTTYLSSGPADRIG